MPKVSFVIPVFDGDAYLAETIESIRRQSLKDIEIVVIDDCSPDFTEDLMDYYTSLDPRIKYTRFETNGGVCEARNYGNRVANADLICVTDQDDISTRHRASYSYLYMLRHPEVDCLTSAYWECNVDAHPIQKWTPDDMSKEGLQKGIPWFHSSACYRKEDILKIPYRVMEGATDDYAFLTDWLEAGKVFKTTKRVLGYCRRVPWGQMQIRRQMQGQQPSFIL